MTSLLQPSGRDDEALATKLLQVFPNHRSDKTKLLQISTIFIATISRTMASQHGERKDPGDPVVAGEPRLDLQQVAAGGGSAGILSPPSGRARGDTPPLDLQLGAAWPSMCGSKAMPWVLPTSDGGDSLQGMLDGLRGRADPAGGVSIAAGRSVGGAHSSDTSGRRVEELATARAGGWWRKAGCVNGRREEEGRCGILE